MSQAFREWGTVVLFLLGAAASGLVETLQYVLNLGRVTAIDDVY